ncbi:MAG: alginate export family protein [Nitrospinota bacterium]
MKKNFLTVAAMAVVAFFVSTEIAKAADITFSGQIRTRMEFNEHSGGRPATGSGFGTAASPSFNNDTDEFTFSSVRLAANANINDTTSAFIQMQSVRNWGNTTTANVADGSGSGNASGTADDADATVGIHQAYFTLKNFLVDGVDMKLGRQEIKLDGWRLFGNTIWTPGMQSHDAVTFHHAHDNMTIVGGYIKAQEDSRDEDRNDANDSEVYLLWGNYKGVLGGQFSAYYVFVDNGCGGVTAAAAGGGAGGCTNGENNFHTIGGRQAGQLFGLDYRGEFYYQFGRADGLSDLTGAPDTDRSAYMFGVRVGKTFGNVMFKPGITLWYDYLSGTTDADQADGEWSSFNTLYDTGHKYYGLQDLFLGVGGGGTAGTQGLGLQDLAVKFKMNPMPGWTLNLDAHAFATAEGICANPTTSGVSCANTSGANNARYETWLGNEFDLTLVNKYNKNTKIMIGFSNFNASAGMKKIKSVTTAGSVGPADANWAYLQFDVQF